MEKYLKLVMVMIFVISGSIRINAASWTGDMKANGKEYSLNFSTGNDSDYVYGKLQNRDDTYGDGYDGPGHVRIEEENGGSWDRICNAKEYLTSNYDYVQCNNNWHNKNEDFKTIGSYDYVDKGSYCSYVLSIWSRLE